jgi:uncharacterized membrane protein
MINTNGPNCMEGPALRKLCCVALVLAMVAPGFAAGEDAWPAIGEYPGGDPHLRSSRADRVIEVRCDRNATVAPPGEPAAYSIGVQNNGNRTEEVLLGAGGTPLWSWTGWNGTISIAPGNRTDVTLEVRAPPEALGGDIGVVTVTAASTRDANLTDSLDTFTTVEEVLGIRVWPKQNETDARPGGTATCNLTVEKTGNSRRPLFLEAFVDGPGWNATFDTVQVNLEGAGEFGVELYITAPPDARGGLGVPVNVSCYDQDRTVEARCTVTALVSLVGNITVTARPVLADLEPGGKALYELELVNSGNGDDVVRPGPLALPVGWTAGFFPRGSSEANGSVAVPFGGKGWLDVVLGAPPDARSGDYDFSGQVLDSTGAGFGFTLGARVARRASLRLEAEMARLGGPPGGSAGFRLQVTNTGNGVSNFSMAASGLPANWSAVAFSLDGQPFGAERALGPGATATVTAAVAIPARTLLESVSFDVSAALAGGEKGLARLTLDIQRPDLRITGVELPAQRARPGSAELIKLTVENAGDDRAANVALALLVDGKLRARLDIGSLGAGERRAEGVLWVPGPGKHLLGFVLDPENIVYERNETNNGAQANRSVPAAGADRGPGQSVLWASLVVAALAAASALTIIRARRLK